MNETSVNHLCFHVNKTLKVLVRLKQTKIWDNAITDPGE